MEDTQFIVEPYPSEPKKQSRRISVWLCLLCVALAAAFAVLLTSLYYVHRFSELQPISEAVELVKKVKSEMALKIQVSDFSK